ncbi:MAG: hypothetical protein C4519_22810 [Desulfobacteraceae bacterium]|nr:MAG: hypothetical protein C4519_22810 [Desulfobacteraceae bacterium]
MFLLRPGKNDFLSLTLKMAKLFLHIGYPKTATTAIQDNLIINQGLLLENGILYPNSGLHIKAHHQIPWIMNNDKRKDLSMTLTGIMEGLRHELKIHKVGDCIISSEGFVFGTQPCDVMKYFREIFSEIEIIIYLRNPYDWVESDYNQGVKAHRNITVTFEEFLTTLMHIRSNPLNFDKIVHKWASVFSFRCTHVRVYQGKHYCIITDFLNTVGMEKPKDWKKPDIADSNPRLNFDEVEFLRLVNHLNMTLEEKKQLLKYCKPKNTEDKQNYTFWLSEIMLKDLLKITEQNRKLVKNLSKKDQSTYLEMLENNNFKRAMRKQNSDLRTLSQYFEPLLRGVGRW